MGSATLNLVWLPTSRLKLSFDIIQWKNIFFAPYAAEELQLNPKYFEIIVILLLIDTKQPPLLFLIPSKNPKSLKFKTRPSVGRVIFPTMFSYFGFLHIFSYQLTTSSASASYAENYSKNQCISSSLYRYTKAGDAKCE